MAKQGADLCISNLRVQFFPVPDCVHKVVKMGPVIAGRRLGFQFLAVQVVDGEVVTGGAGEDTALAIKRDERRRLTPAPVATTLVPHRAAVTKVKRGHAGVRRLLIVIEMVARSAVGDAAGQVRPQSPSREVEGMDAVVGHLAAAVVPVPVPVVRDEVVLVRPFRCRALPQVVVQMLGDGRRFALAD